MKTKQIVINVYEKGDVLDISGAAAANRTHKNGFSGAKRAVVLKVIELKNGLCSYDVLTDEFCRIRLSLKDLRGTEKYIGKLDLSLLGNDD